MNASVQILLKSVLVIENGSTEPGAEGVNVITATLIGPNTTKASVISARSLKLLDKQNFDTSLIPFEDKFLFKEDILGDCMLKIEITAVEKISKLEKFFLKAFPNVFGILIGAIPGIGVIFSSITSKLVGSIFESIDTNDRITVIASGAMPLDAVNQQGELSVNLSVPKTIVVNSAPFFNTNGEELIRRITLPKDFVNAEVVVNITDIRTGLPPHINLQVPSVLSQTKQPTEVTTI